MGIDSDARLSAVRFHGVGHRGRAAGAVANKQLLLYRTSGQDAKSLIRKGMIPIKRRGLIGVRPEHLGWAGAGAAGVRP